MEKTEEKAPYTLRDLCGKDLFPMARIVSKIGVLKFKDAISQDDIKAMVKDANRKSGKSDADDAEVSEDIVTSVGMSVVLTLANVVISNFPACESDIYTFLSGLSGMSAKKIADLRIDIFMDMIVDVVKKPEFENFIQAALRLLS